MINDLPDNVPIQSILYADDSTFIISHNLLHGLEDITLNALSAINLWFSKNGFMANADKTKIITFSLKHGIQNNLTEPVKLLGIYI